MNEDHALNTNSKMRTKKNSKDTMTETPAKTENCDEEIRRTVDATYDITNDAAYIVVVDTEEVPQDEAEADTQISPVPLSIEVEENTGKLGKKGKSTKIRIKEGDTVEEEHVADSSAKLAFVLDIAGSALLFVMSIFFICGTAMTHPAQAVKIKLREPSTFLLLGSVCYIGNATIQVYRRRKKGSHEFAACSSGVLAGFLWFTGSIFMFTATYDPSTFGGLWIAGSMFNLVFISYDTFAMLKKEGAKSLFLAISLALSWLANFMFLVGASLVVNTASGVAGYCENVQYSNTLISGAILYFLHSGFFPLSLFYENYTFTVHISSATLE